MDKELEALEELKDIALSDLDSLPATAIPICEKYNEIVMKDYETIKQPLLKAQEQEKELSCSIVDLLNGLKSKQAALRYFNKYDAIHCHCKEGWYVNMIMYGWIPLKDFIKGLDNKEEK